VSRVNAADLWDEVRKILSVAGPLTVADLYEQVECAEDKKQLTNVLYSRKKAGLLVHHADGRYGLPSQKGARPAAAEQEQQPIAAPPKTDADPVEKFLAESLGTAQRALESYLESVGDRELVKQLSYARDYAKSALETYRRARS
jgi:hypothetical protein